MSHDAKDLVRLNGNLTDDEFTDYLITVKHFNAFTTLGCKQQAWFRDLKKEKIKEIKEEIRKEKEDRRICGNEGCYGNFYKQLHRCSSCFNSSCKQAYAKKIGVKHWELD